MIIHQNRYYLFAPPENVSFATADCGIAYNNPCIVPATSPRPGKTPIGKLIRNQLGSTEFYTCSNEDFGFASNTMVFLDPLTNKDDRDLVHYQSSLATSEFNASTKGLPCDCGISTVLCMSCSIVVTFVCFVGLFVCACSNPVRGPTFLIAPPVLRFDCSREPILRLRAPWPWRKRCTWNSAMISWISTMPTSTRFVHHHPYHRYHLYRKVPRTAKAHAGRYMVWMKIKDEPCEIIN